MQKHSFLKPGRMGQAEELGEKATFLKRRHGGRRRAFRKSFSNELISPKEKEKGVKRTPSPLLSREREEDDHLHCSLNISVCWMRRRMLSRWRVTLASAITPALESELKQRLAQVIGKESPPGIKIDPKILGEWCYAGKTG